MSETQRDLYVRRDVFEARLARIEELYSRTSAEIREIRSDMTDLKASFYSIRSMFLLSSILFWGVLVVMVALTVILRVYQEIHQPSITAKDAERVAKRLVKDAIEHRLKEGA